MSDDGSRSENGTVNARSLRPNAKLYRTRKSEHSNAKDAHSSRNRRTGGRLTSTRLSKGFITEDPDSRGRTAILNTRTVSE